MPPRPIRLRRARRTDFDAIGVLLAGRVSTEWSAGRPALRRFRRVVADLGSDLYVAARDAQVVGVVHVTYARQLGGMPHARLEVLAVDPDARGHGLGRSLIALAVERARRRGCAALRCAAAADSDSARAFLAHAGWQASGAEFAFDLANPAQ